jgi:hypothetical protein
MELETILNDKNWEKLGACKIECINVFDASLKPGERVSIPEAVEEVNNRIQGLINSGSKPKTEIDLLKEQIAALNEKINSQPIFEGIDNVIKAGKKPEPEKTDKEIREELFAEAKELGLTPAKNVKTDILKDLVEKTKSGY